MSEGSFQSLNRVTLIGRLGRRPEMRYTPTGKPVASFSIVMTLESAPRDKERGAETDWFNVVAWGSLAETCKQTLSKGQPVYVEGRIRTRRWQDTSHTVHSRAEIIAYRVFPLALAVPHTRSQSSSYSNLEEESS
jgi:single-strand DNA-binding protein